MELQFPYDGCDAKVFFQVKEGNIKPLKSIRGDEILDLYTFISKKV
jgi:hypothetical protein